MFDYIEFLGLDGYETRVSLHPSCDGGYAVEKDLNPYDNWANFTFVGEIY
ncbi:hypothetical protein J2T22_000043 [Pseudarthrobacter defluvii]|uniref:Uncharacterized protein n=1 Tax=Pseudarthrobacter defluvii TaxID=410837 RepID=A0ABT9UBA4_9MICC|nr:hypothetical protein [Pseudarthrobacter defluvii]MDQ0116881.1 hypothetical protein [Pseudarthrobacter defluvii]MDQ0116883.1 hypothetical protein [Pseudarthrobacter defluvii]